MVVEPSFWALLPSAVLPQFSVLVYFSLQDLSIFDLKIAFDSSVICLIIFHISMCGYKYMYNEILTYPYKTDIID